MQWIVITLLVLGVLMVNSASMGVTGEPLSLNSLLFGRPTIYAVLAIIMMWVMSSIDLRGLFQTAPWANPMHWMLIAGVSLVAVALLPGVGTNINGSSRWLTVGPASMRINFQPSELVKWAMVLVVAWWCVRQGERMRGFFTGYLPAILLVGGVCALIAVEDLGTAVLIGSVALTLILAGGARIWQLALILPGALIGVSMLIWNSPYRVNRLLAFMDPTADPEGTGYHAIQSLVAFIGPEYGLGAGRQKLGYLPAQTNDFIYAVIREELGVIGAIAVVLIFALFVWCGLAVTLRTRHPFTRLVALGITLTIGLQAIINLAVVVVLVPTKGIPLPLISAGGTGWVTVASAIGLLVAIDRISDLEHEGDAPLESIQHQPSRPAPAISVSATSVSA